MKTLTSLIAAAAISIAATGVATADESVADAQVRAALSEQVIHGQAQPAATQRVGECAVVPLRIRDGRVVQQLQRDGVNRRCEQKV